MKWLHAGLALLLAFPLSAPAAAQNLGSSIVSIYADVGNRRVKLGTGFAVEPNVIVTAYHTLQGARSVELRTARGRTTRRVLVRKINPAADLALLTVPDLRFTPVTLSTRIPDTRESLRMVGNALGMPNSSFPVNMVANRLIPIAQLNDTAGRALFEDPPDLAVLQISGIIYSGISGGPLVDRDGEAIGVLNGSLAEGGHYGWAIPSSLVQRLLQADGEAVPVSQVRWPALGLSSGRLRSLAHVARRDEQLAAVASDFTQKLNSLQRANSDLGSSISFGSLISSARISVEATLSTREMMRANFPDYENDRLDFPSSMWSEVQAQSRRLAAALRARERLNRELRLLSARLEDAATTPGLDADQAERMAEVVAGLSRRHRDVSTDSYERMEDINVRTLVRRLDELADREPAPFSSIDEMRTFASQLRSVESDIQKYNALSDFIGWTIRERAYFTDMNRVVQEYYGLLVYVPEAAQSS